jgi:8-oxo-dGTP pyrophosphatase MutT (NUDIX family)
MDLDGRVLLFRGRSLVQHDQYWFTPGGGMEPGESLLDAARRELMEETGLTEFVLGGQVWYRDLVFELDGELVRIEEWAHLVRVPAFEPDTSGFTDLERDTISEFKWWTLSDLKASTDRLSPPDLVLHVDSVLQQQ